MKRTSSYIDRIADIILKAYDDYQYIHDPDHRNRPHGQFWPTDKGWSNDPKDDPKNKQNVPRGTNYPYELTEEDNEYFDAIKKNDTQKLQKMVESRARQSGYNSPIVKHGTSSTHNTFSKAFGGSITDARSARQAFFFVDDDRTANAYAIYSAEEGPIKEALAKSERAEKRGDWDGYEKYIIEAEKLDTPEQRLERRKKARIINSYLSGNFYEYDAEGKTPSELHESGDIDEGITGIIKDAKRKGYSGVIIRNFDDAVGLYNNPADHYIVFNSNQIKSSDPIVKDDNGNIIPLSQRFNYKSKDIRY